jgi:hypothetical protein
VARRCGGLRLRLDCAAVLGFRSRRRTRFTRCARFAQTAAASQRLKRAGTRADRNPALLAAAEAHHRTPAHGFAKNNPQLFWERRTQAGHRARLAPRQRACGARQCAGSMPAYCRISLPKNGSLLQGLGPAAVGLRMRRRGRSPGVGARTRALQHLTRRSCLSATNAVSEASSEPPRLSRRLQHLRRWSHEQDEQVLT